MILPVVLYGCETWSFTVRENIDKVSGSRVQRKTFVPKRDEVTLLEKIPYREVSLPIPLTKYSVIKLRKIKLEVHVERMGTKYVHTLV